MDSVDTWRTCFAQWPEGLNRKGVVVTRFAEQIPFVDFLVSETMLLLERSTPDTIGARKIIMPFEQIAALKIVDVVKNKAFEPLGFRGAGKTA